MRQTLEQIYYINRELKMWERELERLRLRSPVNSPISRNGSGSGFSDPTARNAERIIEVESYVKHKQIAAIFGLSPEIISGTADTQQYMSAVRTAVIPVVEAYQAALNKSLLRESEKGRYYFTLDTTELLKGDTLSRYQAYALGLQNNFLQIDEVRYMEDKEPIGFNYLKLGLQDVLLDPKTNTVYTPNTNQTAQMNVLTNGAGSGIMESEETRVEWTKGEHGYFTGSKPGGGKGHGSSGKSGKTPALHKGGGTASGSPTVDSEGKPYSYPTLRLPKKEYGRVMSEINTHYHTRFEGKSIGRILLSQNVYYFEIHGFSEYNIYGKFKNE